MIRSVLLIIAMAFTLAAIARAHAADAPTVALTQPEIQAIVTAEVASAIAQLKKSEATPVYDKIKAAFTPTSPKPAEAPTK